MSSTPVFERLGVIGLGLVGGSVALAARSRGAAGEVRGVDPGLSQAGPIELTSLPELAAWADALVLSVPVEAVDSVLQELAPLLRAETLITDTVSVKGDVARAARRHLSAPERCIGAHPMAGGEMSGFTHARADLFEGAPCILTPEGEEDPAIVERIEQFWQCLGTFTVRRTPAEHDAIAAVLSHAPHVIAFAFAGGLPGRETLQLAGPGLRDFLRIARGNPKLWSEILLRNRRHIAEEIARFEKNLGGLLDALGKGDREALEAEINKGQIALDELDQRDARKTK